MPGWTNITRDLNPRARSRPNTNPSPMYILLITAGVGALNPASAHMRPLARQREGRRVGTCYALSFEVNSLRNFTTLGATIAVQYP